MLDPEMEHIFRLAESDPIVAKLLRLYLDYRENPSSGWRSMVVFAQKELNILLKNKTIDIVEDGYHRSLWEMLKSGGPVAKTIKSSMEESEDPDEQPLKDSLLGAVPVVPIISAENAGMH